MSFPIYPKYKPSGVGWLGDVPEHWHVQRLRFAAELNPSKSEVSHLDRNTEVSFLPMEAVGDDGTLNLNTVKPISEVENGYTYFRDGDVTVAKITPCFENGKGALMSGLANGIGFGTTELIVVRPKPEKVIGSYLHYLFISSEFRSLGESHMYGAGGQKRVPDAFARNFATAFPPPSEQSQIAAFLDRETSKIDGLVGEQRRLIELLKEKRQAVISHAVTKGLNPHAPLKPSGIQWLGDVPEHWEFGPLKRFWEVVDCKHVTVPFLEDGYPVASVMEVREFELDLSHVLRTSEEFFHLLTDGGRQPRRGDVIYCRNTANTGTSAYVGTDEPIAIGQDVVLIKSGEQNGRFLNYILHSGTMAAQLATLMVGSTFKRINVAEIRLLSVTCPTRDERDSVVEFLDAETTKLDALTAEAERAIELLQERRTALISAAVTGKIDVRNFAPTEAA